MILKGIEISAPLLVGVNQPVDVKFGPYATTAAALAAIGSTLRYKGLTVGIEENGQVVEYWFRDGVANSNLIVKISPASGQVTGLEANVATLTTSLAGEVTRATTAEATLTTGLANEVTRATAAEATLTTNLAAEVTRATTAETALTTSLTTEVTRATTAETTLAADIAAVDLRIDNVLENLDPAKIDSFTEVLTKLSTDKGELSAAIVALGTTASSALANEVTRATTAETALTTSLTAEVTRATTAEATLTTGLANEVTARTNAIAALGTMSTQDSDDVNITGGTITGVSINAESMKVGVGTTADLYVGQDGKVGIGTEAPTQKLTVNGNIDLTGNALKNVTEITTPVAGSGTVVFNTNGDELEVGAATITSTYNGGVELSFEEAKLRVNGFDQFTFGFGETPTNDLDIVRVRELNTKADIVATDGAGNHVVHGATRMFDAAQGVESLVIIDQEVSFYASGMDEEYRKMQQTNFSNALDLQKKLVISNTPPAHIDGREWLDTTDYRRYISISGAWIEGVVVA